MERQRLIPPQGSNSTANRSIGSRSTTEGSAACSELRRPCGPMRCAARPSRSRRPSPGRGSCGSSTPGPSDAASLWAGATTPIPSAGLGGQQLACQRRRSLRTVSHGRGVCGGVVDAMGPEAPMTRVAAVAAAAAPAQHGPVPKAGAAAAWRSRAARCYSSSCTLRSGSACPCSDSGSEPQGRALDRHRILAQSHRVDSLICTLADRCLL
mmetsp:Transcript_29658/g.81631  ORF Transcript_29658/g.81631 Transcript_29658/m.81631 type:complete len:210 (-) Transcript_29658:194-823(-)